MRESCENDNDGVLMIRWTDGLQSLAAVRGFIWFVKHWNLRLADHVTVIDLLRMVYDSFHSDFFYCLKV